MSDKLNLLSPVLSAHATGDIKLARLLCSTITEANPDYAEAFALLAELCLSDGDPASATIAARRARTIGPAPTWRDLLVQCLSALSMQRAQENDALSLCHLLDQLLALAANNEAEAVYAFLHEAFRSDPAIAVGVQVVLQRNGQAELLQHWGHVPPRALLVLPPRIIAAAKITRFAKSIAQNTGVADLTLATRSEIDHATPTQDYPCQPFTPESLLCFSHVVCIEQQGEFAHSQELARSHPRVYRFDQTSEGFEPRLMPVGRELCKSDYPYVDSHIFNRVTSKLDGHYYFFPYGYLFRYLGFGPINAFGHRIACDLEGLRQRPGHHKLILCFGGSACFSMYCLHDEMFPSRLESHLNAQAQRQGSDTHFTVLNFGQHGNVVLNEITTHLLFAEGLKPDVIISHSGFNDLVYGQLADTYLVAEHQIVYQENLEAWAAMLNGTPDDLPADRFLNGIRQVQNTPDAVLSAYITRMRQFAALTTACGAQFVWGLQPWLLSKQQRSGVEKQIAHEHQQEFGSFADGYRNLPFLYDEVIARADEIPATRFINLHSAFAKTSSDTSHFLDVVHLSPAGDELIAQWYAEALGSLFSI